MSLQFIIGNSGAGKSFRAYQRVIREAAAHPEKMYYVTDLSSNGTFLEDGIRLQPQTETAVERGEKIYLSNQKDVFCLS